LLSSVSVVGLGLGTSDPDSEYEYGFFGPSQQAQRPLTPRFVQEECSVEKTIIDWTNCKVEFEEACSSEEKVVGDKITFDQECEEKEVEECKPVHYVPRSKIGSFGVHPQQLDSECAKVKKQVCKDIPKKEAVMKEVEICVRTPKETCEKGTQTAPITTCERVKH